MGYFRPFLEKLEAYVPGEQPRSYEGVIKLNANENAYPPPLGLEDDLHHTRIDDLRYYPDAVSRDLRRSLASMYNVTPDEVFVGNGGDEILRLIVQATIEPGERVTYPYPSYVLYRTLSEIAQAEINEIDLTETFQLPENFAEKIGRLVFLCSPNNPTGNCLSEAAILRVLETARDRAIVVVDEAYADFSDQNFIPLIRQFDNLLVLRSFSKSYSLAGLRLGVAIAHFEIISCLFKLKDSYNLNALTQRLALRAILETVTMRSNVTRAREARTQLSRALEALGFDVYPSDANFVLIEHPSQRAGHIYRELKKRNILVRHFSIRRLENCLRVTVGREDENASLIAALREIL